MTRKPYISKERKRKNSKAFKDMLEFLVIKKDFTTKLDMNETFSLDDISPAPGTWYFVTDCYRCEKPVPLLEDPSQGDLGNPFQGPGACTVNCPHCRKPVSAIASRFRALRWPEVVH